MKRMTDEYKNVTVVKSRDKSFRTRNKRKCKRKKNARMIKRFCDVKETAVHYSSAEYQHGSRHLTAGLRLAGRDPCAEIRLKNAQNVWISAYQRVVKWNTKYQTHYWKHCAHQLKAENNRLKRSMLAVRFSANSGSPIRKLVDSSESDEDYHNEKDPFGDTEDESADEWNAMEGYGDKLQRQRRRTSGDEDQPQEDERAERDELDEEFLAFMEVSARHRLEHRRQKNESVH
uniref:Uncharacterized protein n=1 Tax=Anopheles christyi TaxID=43041 RepID=A0A182JT86_9DIPT